jgi:hypothetical protein
MVVMVLTLVKAGKISKKISRASGLSCSLKILLRASENIAISSIIYYFIDWLRCLSKVYGI